jgi:hypothetical protein
MNDQEAIIRSLVRRGINRNAIEVHDKAVTTNMFNGQTATANIVVRQNYIEANKQKIGMDMTRYSRAFADIGFLKQEDGTYQAVVDGSKFDKPWLDEISQGYNAEKTKMELDKRKIKYVESRTDTGAIQIKAQFAQQQSTNRRLTGRTVSFG